jgi:hypothetical protein
VGRAAAKFDVELVGLLDELLPDPLLPDALLDDGPVLLLPEFELVTDGLVMDVLVGVLDTLDDDPLPVMETVPVSEEAAVSVAVLVGILPVTSKPQMFSTKDWA